MAKKQSGKRVRRPPKTVLRLPDLGQAKSAVLNSLRFDGCPEGIPARYRRVDRVVLSAALGEHIPDVERDTPSGGVRFWLGKPGCIQEFSAHVSLQLCNPAH
jgi:hypothetical protein